MERKKTPRIPLVHPQLPDPTRISLFSVFVHPRLPRGMLLLVELRLHPGNLPAGRASRDMQPPAASREGAGRQNLPAGTSLILCLHGRSGWSQGFCKLGREIFLETPGAAGGASLGCRLGQNVRRLFQGRTGASRGFLVCSFLFFFFFSDEILPPQKPARQSKASRLSQGYTLSAAAGSRAAPAFPRIAADPAGSSAFFPAFSQIPAPGAAAGVCSLQGWGSSPFPGSGMS